MPAPSAASPIWPSTYFRSIGLYVDLHCLSLSFSLYICVCIYIYVYIYIYIYICSFKGLRPRPGSAGRSLEQGTPPPLNPADADDALRASATHSKIGKTLPRTAGPVAGAPSAHDARRLASWGCPPGSQNPPSSGEWCVFRKASGRGPARPGGKTRVR